MSELPLYAWAEGDGVAVTNIRRSAPWNIGATVCTLCIRGGDQVTGQMDATQMQKSLEEFLELFNKYSAEIFGDQRQEQLDELRKSYYVWNHK